MFSEVSNAIHREYFLRVVAISINVCLIPNAFWVKQHTIDQWQRRLFISFDFFNKSVALAGRCFHQPTLFRHRNMYLIRVDHLPLGKVVISNFLCEWVTHNLFLGLTHSFSEWKEEERKSVRTRRPSRASHALGELLITTFTKR